MILTNCAACAAPLGLALGKKCGRCSTRYCGPACQKQHWDGGHKAICKKIKKAGGAEQYNANEKYTEAVSVAAEACAEDTKGQTCYICTQALHWKTKEGLVRMCACRGTAGFAHVSCLAEQAKILVAEAEENNLGGAAIHSRFQRWHTCSLCEQDYHGLVRCALGWACWKTYLGRPEHDLNRVSAMTQLGCGLSETKQYKDAATVQEADLAIMRRLGASEHHVLVTQGNLANTYEKLGQKEPALSLQRDVYFGLVKLYGEEKEITLSSSLNYASILIDLKRFKEAKSLLRKTTPVARRVLGESCDTTLLMRRTFAEALYKDPTATLDGVREAVTMLEELAATARRLLGGAHPDAVGFEASLRNAQFELQGKLLSSRVSLRFAVGMRVKCFVGGDKWAPGRIIKLHHHEASFEPGFFAPYQIRLDDGGLIYAPEDRDTCIREFNFNPYSKYRDYLRNVASK